MKVKPNESYKLLGTSIQLDKTRIYRAVIARNQPDYKKLGKVFVGGVLLQSGEYTVVK